MGNYSTPEGVGPEEEYWDEYEVEFTGETAVSVIGESLDETKARIAEKKNTNINSVSVITLTPEKMDPREGVIVRGHYYNFTRHNADLEEESD
jgi:hypothetical protein